MLRFISGLCFILALATPVLSGCGSSGDGGNGDPVTCETSAVDSLCVVLSVPDTYDGSPVKVSALGFDSLPPSGMPNAFFGDKEKPLIGVGRPYKLELNDISFSGTTNFYVALYMEGGGSMAPVAGVDYVAWVADLDFDGSPINLPQMDLELYQEP